MRTFHEETVQARPLHIKRTEYSCDRCAQPIPSESTFDTEPSILEIGLNNGECISYTRLRDYCSPCLEIVWYAIHEIIGGDPEKIGSDRDYDSWDM